MFVELRAQRRGRRHRDLVGHRHHRRHPQIAHQTLAQPAEHALGLRRGALAGRKEREVRQAAGPAQLAQPLDQDARGHGSDLALRRRDEDDRLTVVGLEPAVGDHVQQRVRLPGDRVA